MKTTRKHDKDSVHVLLHLENKEHHLAYSKGDIWVISKDRDFKTGVLMKSMYYGLTESNIEVSLYMALFK